MRLNDFRIGWRTLLQEPGYSLVVVLGLGIGFAACLLLLGFVRYSWDYNKSIPQVDQLYVVKMRDNIQPDAPWFDQAPLALRAAALKAPGVEQATVYLSSRPQKTTARMAGQLREISSLTVLPGFAELLGLQALQGDLKAALTTPEGLAITEDAALRLFGTANALGKSVEIEGKLLRVAAILRTPPSNTTIAFETVVGVASLIVDAEVRDEMLTGSRGWWAKLLVKVRPGASLPAITAALQQAADALPRSQKLAPAARQRLGQRHAMDIVLTPLGDAYFDQKIAMHFIFAPGDRADPAAVAGLAVIAVLILLLAAINYVNLATVRVLRRQREVAMRKVLGADGRQIALQFLAESLLVALVATLLGLLLAWLLLPVFAELVNRKLEGMLSAENIGAAFVLAGVLGVLTALYPAWIALHVRPSQVLAGRPNSESLRGMRLRRVMTVMQVATAMGLASVTLAVAWQTGFAMRASHGFDPAQILIVDLPDGVRYDKRASAFIAALKAQPAVAGVAISEDAIGRRNSFWTREIARPGIASTPADMKSVSANFFEQYRIKPVAGRLFAEGLDKEDDHVPLVINELAVRKLGFASPAAAVGQSIQFTNPDEKVVVKRIVGVAPDIRFMSLHAAPTATAYELWPAGFTLSVRAAGSVAEVERVLGETWSKYYQDAVLKTRRAGDILADNYAEEARLARLLAIATGIALVIAAFGTYVLSAHTVQRRAREIVLRKLYGAGRLDIAALVLREIGALTMLAALIGLPLALVLIQRHLATYVEQVPYAWLSTPLALAATLAVALLAVARHARIAMRMMPADALRL